MAEKFDVVIVGTGPLGVAGARGLAEFAGLSAQSSENEHA